jgi:formylglycine-generating enzyme required for sulfatase activity
VPGGRWTIAVVAIVLLAVAGVAAGMRLGRERAPCGAAFSRAGPRCCPTPTPANEEGACVFTAGQACPTPLVLTEHGCDAAERDAVAIPAMTVTVGPSDWEAEGRVVARTAFVPAFAIDRLEVTAGRACASRVFAGASFCDRRDPARAAFGVTLAQAKAYCAERGGRLPSEDEWLAAAGGERPRRYPWGDTGAVCRRAGWGLFAGPCAEDARGPDTVGAHPDGATPLGVHDLAGNVEEWVTSGVPVVRGGSWKTRLATELRTWLRREAPPDVKDPTIGFRCAYGGVP